MGVSLAGLFLAGISSYHLLGSDSLGKTFGGALISDRFTHSVELLLELVAVLAVLMAGGYLNNRRLPRGEYYSLVLFSTCGAMVMGAANDLITLFIALETLSIALYVLTAYSREKAKSDEAALKYFLLGAFAAGFFLYGIALIYGGSAETGIGGTTSLATIGSQLMLFKNATAMITAGFALILVGLGFKAALFPFHMWVPDVYEGAPTAVTGYMAAVVKIAIFSAILRIFNAFSPIANLWMPTVICMAGITMVLGNLLALAQVNVKRMLAYSSIGHAGYLLCAAIASVHSKGY